MNELTPEQKKQNADAVRRRLEGAGYSDREIDAAFEGATALDHLGEAYLYGMLRASINRQVTSGHALSPAHMQHGQTRVR